MKRDIIVGVLTIVLLSGCTASNLIRRAKRKDPSLFTTQIDTVRDTVFIKVASIDTVFRYNFDTVEYWQDKVFIKYHYDTLTNNVFIEADCPDEQIITEVITNTEIVTLEPTLRDKLMGGVYVGVCLLALLVLGTIVRKFL